MEEEYEEYYDENGEPFYIELDNDYESMGYYEDDFYVEDYYD